MALEGKEPVGSMGTDIPLAVLSDQRGFAPQEVSTPDSALPTQVSERLVF